MIQLFLHHQCIGIQISAPLKAFIEHWSETLQDKRYPNFKAQMAEKDFRVILVGGDCPKIKVKPAITQMKYSLDFLGATLNGYYWNC